MYVIYVEYSLQAMEYLQYWYKFLSKIIGPRDAIDVLNACIKSACETEDPEVLCVIILVEFCKAIGIPAHTVFLHMVMFESQLLLTEGWKKGDIALVIHPYRDEEELCISFWNNQTFIVDFVVHSPNTGQLLLGGNSKFTSTIEAYRCRQAAASDNPYPLCLRKRPIKTTRNHIF